MNDSVYLQAPQESFQQSHRRTSASTVALHTGSQLQLDKAMSRIPKTTHSIFFSQQHVQRRSQSMGRDDPAGARIRNGMDGVHRSGRPAKGLCFRSQGPPRINSPWHGLLLPHGRCSRRFMELPPQWTMGTIPDSRSSVRSRLVRHERLTGVHAGRCPRTSKRA